MKLQYKNTMFKQQGFSLLEALVGFLILSIGMLGVASLQLMSLKSSRTAMLRTVAVIKSEEILERIRNNPTMVLSYAVVAGDLGVDAGCNDSTGSVKSCTPIEMVSDDIFNWKADLKTSLPNNAGTTASVEVVAPGVKPTATVTVSINWQQRNRETQTMDDKTYSVSADMCVSTSC